MKKTLFFALKNHVSKNNISLTFFQLSFTHEINSLNKMFDLYSHMKWIWETLCSHSGRDDELTYEWIDLT